MLQYQKGNVEFEVDYEQVPLDKPYYLPEKQTGDERKMMEPYKKKDFDKFFNNIYKNGHPAHSKNHRQHNPFRVKQDIEVEDNKYEKIHMPKFGVLKESLVLHDFTRVSINKSTVSSSYKAND